jgi:CheY-like chemotaxis protein
LWTDITNVPQTLLLADDSLTIQRVIELTFAGEDIKVVAVSDGDQAIARLDTEPPDIVLADVGMPGRSGYDVAQHVKQSPSLAHIPVVLLTGAFEPVDQVKAAAVGCDAVLAKPFDPQLVIGRVRELLRRPTQAMATSTVAAEMMVARVADASASFSAPVAAAEAPPGRDQQVEAYFERLDAAFASLSNSAPPPVSTPPDNNDLDWMNMYAADEAAAAATQPDLPIEPQSFVVADELAAEPATAPEPPPVPEPHEPREPEPLARLAPLASLEPVEPREPLKVVSPPASAKSLPSVADAFAAILSAEQSAIGARPEWPLPQPVEPPPPPAPPEPVISDDVIDRIARRVIEQLSDRVVRETAANIASETAERLVREEIERIKAAIPPSENPAS